MILKIVKSVKRWQQLEKPQNKFLKKTQVDMSAAPRYKCNPWVWSDANQRMVITWLIIYFLQTMFIYVHGKE